MKKLIIYLILLISTTLSFAEEKATELTEEEAMEMYLQYSDSIEKSFVYKKGNIHLGEYATIKIPESFHFLDEKDGKKVVVDLWGNPDQEILGLIMPEKYKATSDSSWAFIITFDDMGFVKDEDANKMDYDELLSDLKKETLDANPEREKLGYEPITLIGWAAKPFYDHDRKALHWAKELKFGTQSENTLNYDIRLLGRKGVLSLNAVGSIDQLKEVKPEINKLIGALEFNEGQRYKDFDPKLDKVAAYTVGGLVAGKVLAKAGIFAIIAKFGKVIVLAVIGAFGLLKNKILALFGKKTEETTITHENETNS